MHASSARGASMGAFIYGLSRRLAWFGGFVLGLLALLSVVSILGRALSRFGLGPVPGDFELVEAGTALAVFCFLPWCHLRRGHAAVDLFWNQVPRTLRPVVEGLTEALMVLVWVLLAWRLGVGMNEYRANAETSFILHMPVWWGYAASFVPALIGCLVYVWRLLEVLGLARPPAGFAPGVVEH